jgi:hypothetical protein
MTDLHKAAQQALWALQYHVEMTWPIDRTSEAIFNLRTALAQQDEPAQQTRKDGDYSVAYRCECGHKQNVTEIVRGGRTYAGSGANWCDGCGDGPPVRVDAIQQQAEPKGGGRLPPPLQAEPVTEDMKAAVRWAPSSAYWSERLREFFGPDAREGIDALERRIAGAQEQAEPDLSLCPQRLPLTDEEIVRIFETPELAGTHFQTPTLKAIAVARAIERAHGIVACGDSKGQP